LGVSRARHDPLPFSFANCQRVLGCSPLSPIGFGGELDAEEVRDHVRYDWRRWLNRSLDGYPPWMRRLVLHTLRSVSPAAQAYSVAVLPACHFCSPPSAIPAHTGHANPVTNGGTDGVGA